MKKTIHSLTLFVSFILILTSCGEDEDPKAKSPEKAIASFKFSALLPEVIGSVSESTKTIAVTVPNGTVVTALVPTLVVSEKATVVPASGVVQNFTSPVTYTVTAEDGTTQDYVVTVTISATVNFTLDDYTGLLELEQDGVIIIRGDNFGAAANNKIVFVDNDNESVTFESAAGLASTDEILLAKVPATLPLGEYKVKVFIGAQSKFIDEVFTVTPHAPQITGVDKTSLLAGESITITGSYFANPNTVKFTIGSSVTVTLEVVSQNATTIVAKVPEGTDPDDYTLSVTTNGKQSFYNTNQITVDTPPNLPTITEIVDTSVARGQTLIIRGTNLRKIGFASNINFSPFPSGVTQIRSGVANTAGTEVTYVIPMDFPTGNYTISIEVDFEFSEEYGDVIQITP